MGIDPDIASQMGFISFGTQPTARKRKYSPAADAVTDQAATLDTPGYGKRGGTRSGWEGGGGGGGDRASGGSGSNNTPLGLARRKQEPLGHRMDEEDRPGQAPVAETGATRGDKATSQEWGASSIVDEYGEPSYVDDTPPGSPVANLEGEHTQPIEAHKHRPPIFHLPDSAAHETTQLIGEGDGTRTVGERGTWVVSEAQGQRYDWVALRRGVRNRQGDMAYYDRSFVEDPWRELKGLSGYGS